MYNDVVFLGMQIACQGTIYLHNIYIVICVLHINLFMVKQEYIMFFARTKASKAGGFPKPTVTNLGPQSHRQQNPAHLEASDLFLEFFGLGNVAVESITLLDQ